MPGAAILSPHPDDAVLSLWHVLAGPGDLQVVNVLAGVPGPEGGDRWWDRLTGAADSAVRMRERHAEDARALALAGRVAVHLPFLEGQYRDEPLPVTPVAERIATHLEPGAPVLAPAALNGHPGHVLVRSAALALRSAGHPVSLYADVPHATVFGWPAFVTGRPATAHLDPAAHWEHQLATAGLDLAELRLEVHVLSAGDLERKREAVSAYATQWPVLDAAWGVSRPEILRYEVLWPLPA